MNPLINKLSKRIFWDTDTESIDLQKHKAFIISRVLEYGTIEDWQFIKEQYGLDTIVQSAASLRTLDKKALAFISVLSGKPKEEFRCYINQQSVSPHLNF